MSVKELEREIDLMRRAMTDAVTLLTADSRVGVMTWRNRIDGAVGILKPLVKPTSEVAND